MIRCRQISGCSDASNQLFVSAYRVVLHGEFCVIPRTLQVPSEHRIDIHGASHPNIAEQSRH